MGVCVRVSEGSRRRELADIQSSKRWRRWGGGLGGEGVTLIESEGARQTEREEEREKTKTKTDGAGG